ncbi:hypothetical protein GCM10023336_05200 [Streptomyces similanensis]|uniref:Uncharacterized protein n=1 Tax=Streptomyces similanensis TaxID=1274988 RepID=A0ABP9JUG8_9ACTN
MQDQCPSAGQADGHDRHGLLEYEIRSADRTMVRSLVQSHPALHHRTGLCHLLTSQRLQSPDDIHRCVGERFGRALVRLAGLADA